MIITEKVHGTFDYLEARPDGFDGGRKYPAIIFLHGAGSRGRDVSVLKINALFREIDQNMDCLIFAPQCYAFTWFDIFEQLREFILFCREQPCVDPERFYLMGTSLGGYATWQMAESMPEIFAAAVPICGGGIEALAYRLKSVPVWAFHGADDDVVSPEHSKTMVEAVNRRGGNARLTLREGVQHNVWDYAYTHRELFDWLFAQKLQKSEQTETQFASPEKFG